MNKRRHVGDIAWIDDDEGGCFLGRIDGLGADQTDVCTKAVIDPEHDQNCKCWPNVEILTDGEQSTGEYVYHVNECEMHDTK